MRRLLLVAAISVALAGCATDQTRASGITERWLQAVGDQGREALRDEARERASTYGDPQLAGGLIPPNPEENERYFADLEVGKSVESGNEARVPFRANARLADGDTKETDATAVLVRAGDTWRVTGIVDRQPNERLPSEGGDPPSRARPAHWIGTVLFGFVLTIVSVLLVERQPRASAGARSSDDQPV
jgi:hypothetical protein